MYKYNAVVFDLDGTIVDDELDWKLAFQAVAEKNGINKKIEPVAGMSLEESWKRNGEKEKAQQLALLTRKEFVEIVNKKEYMEPRIGFLVLVEYLKEKGFMLALATSSYWEVADAELEKLGLHGIFDAITTGEEVANLKPDPEMYRLTCQKLGVDAEEVIVFEDADPGIEAATECGCKVIRVEDDYDFGQALELYRGEGIW